MRSGTHRKSDDLNQVILNIKTAEPSATLSPEPLRPWRINAAHALESDNKKKGTGNGGRLKLRQEE